MYAVVYHGPGDKSWEEVPKPTIVDDTDAIIRVDAVTICGTDLHILKGDVPAVTPGRILGHEAVGTIEAVGTGVKTRKAGEQQKKRCRLGCGGTHEVQPTKAKLSSASEMPLPSGPYETCAPTDVIRRFPSA